MDKKLIVKIRDVIYSTSLSSLDINSIAHKVNMEVSDLMRLFPTSEKLAEDLLQLEIEELDNLLDSEAFAKERAVDSIIMASIAVYHKFEHLSPSGLSFLNKLYPELFQEALKTKIQLIKQHFENNLNKGIANGEYNQVDINNIIDKYCTRISQLYMGENNESKTYTFGYIFNVIFEDYIEEVATPENWHYFRNRKQLVEILNFGK